MANLFRTYTANNIATSLTTVGSNSGNNTATIIGLTLSNTTNTAVLVDVAHKSNTATTYIVKNAPITAGSSLVPIGGDQKIVLHGEEIQVSANTASSVDVEMSLLIQTV